MTVDELRKHLEGIPGKAKITFGQLSFGRIKKRGDDLYNIELHPMAYWSTELKEWLLTGDTSEPEINS